MLQHPLSSKGARRPLLLELLIIPKMGIIPHSRLILWKPIIVRMDKIPRQTILWHNAVHHTVDSYIPTDNILESQEQVSEHNMDYLMLQDRKHIIPTLFGIRAFLKNFRKKVLIEIELDESVSGDTSDGSGINPVVSIHKDLLELLNDMSIELLMPGEIDNALNQLFGYINITL
jgi:hypothetical protein